MPWSEFLTPVTFQPDPRVADRLVRLPESPFAGEVWKHTMPGQKPDQANTKGARWNPPDVPALYFALDRATAEAEGDYLASVQPQPIRGVREVHRIEIALRRVVDLSDAQILQELGVSDSALRSNDHSICRSLGGTAEWFGYDAIIVPSARHAGRNLVVFPRRTTPDFEVSVVESSPRDQQSIPTPNP